MKLESTIQILEVKCTICTFICFLSTFTVMIQTFKMWNKTLNISNVGPFKTLQRGVNTVILFLYPFHIHFDDLFCLICFFPSLLYNHILVFHWFVCLTWSWIRFCFKIQAVVFCSNCVLCISHYFYDSAALSPLSEVCPVEWWGAQSSVVKQKKKGIMRNFCVLLYFSKWAAWQTCLFWPALLWVSALIWLSYPTECQAFSFTPYSALDSSCRCRFFRV